MQIQNLDIIHFIPNQILLHWIIFKYTMIAMILHTFLHYYKNNNEFAGLIPSLFV